jgi:hypothetical protein
MEKTRVISNTLPALVSKGVSLADVETVVEMLQQASKAAIKLLVRKELMVSGVIVSSPAVLWF